MDVVKHALMLGREYVIEAIVEHDAKYHRHPATELERTEMCENKLLIEEALACYTSTLPPAESEVPLNLCRKALEYGFWHGTVRASELKDAVKIIFGADLLTQALSGIGITESAPLPSQSEDSAPPKEQS